MGIPSWQLTMAGLENFSDEELLAMILRDDVRSGYIKAVLQGRQHASRNLRRHKILRKVEKYFNDPENAWRRLNL